MRLHGDEIVSPELAAMIAALLPGLTPEVEGVALGPRITFMGKPHLNCPVFVGNNLLKKFGPNELQSALLCFKIVICVFRLHNL
jgi:hypothetical protein